MRSKMPFLRLILFLGAAFVLTVAAIVYFVRIDRVVVAKGRLMGGSVAVRAPCEGQVAQKLVNPGEHVEAGQTVVLLESKHLDAQEEQIRVRLRSIGLQIEALEAERKRLVSEVHPAETGRTKRAVERARLELANADLYFNRIKNLWVDERISKSEYENAELVLKLAKLSLKESEQALEDLAPEQKAGFDRLGDERKQLEGRIAEEEAAMKELERQRALCRVEAGQAGLVLGTGLFELEGKAVQAGDELLRLAVGPAERFLGRLDDSGRTVAAPGQRVMIRLDGYPWLLHGTLPGTVTIVAQGRDGDSGFPVEITINPKSGPGPLYEGMGGEARIVIEEEVSLGRLLMEKISGKQGP
ncbi:MAG: hypothetical protein ABIK28_06845 [Planctomycetota bacterium]